MRTPSIIALAGVIAVSAGLGLAADTAGNQAAAVRTHSRSDNYAVAPRTASPVPSSAVSTPTSALIAPRAAPSPAATVAMTPARTVIPVGPRLTTVGDHPVVYLTFDDGPSLTHTPLILDVLARHHARATFFVIGRFARRYPQLIAAELAAGNSVGSHTWSHPHLPKLSEQLISDQLVSTRHLLRSLGANAQCFRPPFGETNAIVHRVESRMGIHEYLWTTETKDWTHTSARVDLKRADAGLHPGAIIVFHDGHGSGSKQAVAAVDELLRQAEAKGYVALPLPC